MTDFWSACPTLGNGLEPWLAPRSNQFWKKGCQKGNLSQTLTMKMVSAGDRDEVPVLPPAGMDGLEALILGRCPVRLANATVYIAAALRA